MTYLYEYPKEKCAGFWDKYFTWNVEDECLSDLNGIFLNSHSLCQSNLPPPVLKNQNESNKFNSHTSISNQTHCLSMEPHGVLCHSLEVDVYNGGKHDPSSFNLIMCFLSFITAACCSLFIASNYMKQALITLEQSHSFLTFLIFFILFIFVSLPMTWGYILLNMAAGYLYGVILGTVVVFVCAMIGITTAHFLVKHSLKKCILSYFSNNRSFRSIVAVVESRHGFKVIVLARLTPIPFGLQNALFGLCRISLCRYLSASTVGMLPTQGLHIYIGSTLRSMQDIITSSHKNDFAQIVFCSQCLLVGALLIIVLKKARAEFNKAVHEAEYNQKHITLI